MTLAPELTALERAVDRAVARLLGLQHPDGWWKGELESNATMIAQHLFWHHFVGLRRRELDRKIANELLARQRADGTWAIWFEGPGDLDTTIEAYAALRLCGVDPGPPARDFIRSRRSPSTTSPAGRGGRWCRSPSSRRCGRCALPTSTSATWARVPARRGRPAGRR